VNERSVSLKADDLALLWQILGEAAEVVAEHRKQLS